MSCSECDFTKKKVLQKQMSRLTIFSFTYLIIIRTDEILAFWCIWTTLSCKNFFLFILSPEFQAFCRLRFNERKQGVGVREGHVGTMASGGPLRLRQRAYWTPVHTGGLFDFTKFERVYCAIYRHKFGRVTVFYHFSGWSYDFVLIAVKQSYPHMK